VYDALYMDVLNILLDYLNVLLGLNEHFRGLLSVLPVFLRVASKYNFDTLITKSFSVTNFQTKVCPEVYLPKLSL